MTLNKEPLYLVVSIFLVALTGFSITPIILSFTTLEQFGEFNLLIIIVNAMNIFNAIRNPFVSYWNEGYNSRVSLIKCTRAVVLYLIAVIFVLLLCCYFLLDSEFNKSIVISMLISAPIMLLNILVSSILDAEGKTGTTSMIRAVSWVVFYLCILMLSIDCNYSKYYPLAIVLMSLTTFSLLIIVLEKKYFSKVFLLGVTSYACNKEYLKAIFNQFRFFSTNVICGFLEGFILFNYLPGNHFGAFSGMTELVSKSLIIPRTIHLYMYPKLMAEEKIRYKYKYIIMFNVVIVLLLFIFCFTLKDFIFDVYFSGKMDNYESYFYMVVLGVSFKFFGYSSGLIYNLEGDFKSQRKIIEICMPISIVISFFVINEFGLVGAIISFLVVRIPEIIVFAFMLHKNRKVLLCKCNF